MYSLKEMPATASTLFSAYASLSASIMLLRSMASDVVPPGLRSYLYSALHRLFTPVSPTLTLVIDELSGMARNEVCDAAQIYLRTKISPATDQLRVSKTPRQKHLRVAIEKGGEIDDKFENLDVKWWFICVESKDDYSGENRSFELSFNKKFKDTVLISYLPYIQLRAKAIKEEEKVIKLYSRDCPGGDDDEGGDWGSIHLEHPSTLDTLAMDPDLKKAIVDDLDRFLRRKEFYKKVGKAWKRGYLLFGPPGTGKSSLVAAMANYLRFDVYDLELTSVYRNSDLRRILLSTTNRSILVKEDIDCGVQMQNREDSDEGEVSHNKFTLSALLNFIDGLWSSCGDERIIVFTTNHKDRLDPALLRPGRMDMHINMSYLTSRGFKTLASNYHDIHHHSSNTLYAEIEGLLDSTKATPADGC